MVHAMPPRPQGMVGSRLTEAARRKQVKGNGRGGVQNQVKWGQVQAAKSRWWWWW